MCFPLCDPLTQDCVRGQGCYSTYQGWICTPDASGELGDYGDPCEFLNACDPGFVCVSAEQVSDCSGSAGCCTDICTLEIPICLGADSGEICVPWDDDPPPDYEDVGVCLLPE